MMTVLVVRRETKWKKIRKPKFYLENNLVMIIKALLFEAVPFFILSDILLKFNTSNAGRFFGK